MRSETDIELSATIFRIHSVLLSRLDLLAGKGADMGSIFFHFLAMLKSLASIKTFIINKLNINVLNKKR